MTDQINFSFARPVSAKAVQELLQQTGWAATRAEEDIQVMLDNSSLRLGAWRGDRLVGFARVLTDDRFRAFIDDVVITEEERGQGIGHALMTHLMQRLAHLEEVTLFCDETVVPFYEQHNFERASGSATMKWHSQS